MRSSATTERGISSSRKPTTRIGNASSVNNAIACTRSPGETAPVDTRQPPTASSATIAEVRERIEGRLEQRAQRTDADPRHPQLVGGVAQPLHFGVLAPERLHDHAPSKLSCVIADTSPTRSCTVCAGSSTRRV